MTHFRLFSVTRSSIFACIVKKKKLVFSLASWCWQLLNLWCDGSLTAGRPFGFSVLSCGGFSWGWQWLWGCLDGLDKDIRAKQKATLCRGRRHGQTGLFSILVGGVGHWGLRESGGGETDWLWTWHIFILLMIYECFMLFICYSNTAEDIWRKWTLFGKQCSGSQYLL